MFGTRKRRRVQIFAASAALLLVSAALVGFALREGVSYFRSPAQIIAELPAPTEVFRVGGLVESGSIQRHGEGRIGFEITDGSALIEVTYKGVLPDLFAEGQGVIALGTFDGTQFRATEILAKHDENYMPREVVEALKEQGVYRNPE